MEVSCYVLDLLVLVRLALMKARLFVSYVCLVIMILAGRPFTMTPSGMFLVTTLPAAITAFSPTVTLGSMVTAPPITTLSSIVEGVRHPL